MNLRIPGGLFALALALAATLAYQAFAPVPPIAAAQVGPVPHAETSLTVPVFQPPPEQDFAIINRRAAFDPARQPVAEPSETADTNQPPPDVSLVGVAIGPQKSVALLKAANGGSATSAEVGQIVEGWQIVRIESGSVVFHANATDFTVTLRKATGLAPPIAAPERTRRPPMPGQPPSGQ
jgi:type II secretory pathway component PulC